MKHPREYYKHVFYAVKFGLGILFILIGIAGIFLPIIPGLIFLILGMVFIGVKKKWLKKMFRKHKWTRNSGFIKWLVNSLFE